MKATGIVRRIDDLGRVVIPKEIRKTLRIREGDPLEIFTDREGEIILKKYSPIGELALYTKEFAESLHQTTGHIVCFCDKDEVISASGGAKKEFFEKHISPGLDKLLNSRSPLTAKRGDASFIQIFEDDEETAYKFEHITPIISEGDVLGGIIILSATKKMGELEEKMAQMTTLFLAKQMES